MAGSSHFIFKAWEPTKHYCCCGCSLRTGGMLLMAFNCLFNLFKLWSMGVSPLAKALRHDGIDGFNSNLGDGEAIEWSIFIGLCLFSLQVIFSFLGFLGASQRNSHYLQMFLYGLMLDVVVFTGLRVTALMMVSDGVNLSKNKVTAAAIIVVVSWLVQISMDCFLIQLTYSLGRKLTRGESVDMTKAEHRLASTTSAAQAVARRSYIKQRKASRAAAMAHESGGPDETAVLTASFLSSSSSSSSFQSSVEDPPSVSKLSGSAPGASHLGAEEQWGSRDEVGQEYRPEGDEDVGRDRGWSL